MFCTGGDKQQAADILEIIEVLRMYNVNEVFDFIKEYFQFKNA